MNTGVTGFLLLKLITGWFYLEQRGIQVIRNEVLTCELKTEQACLEKKKKPTKNLRLRKLGLSLCAWPGKLRPEGYTWTFSAIFILCEEGKLAESFLSLSPSVPGP